jgi:hypothetical protein
MLNGDSAARVYPLKIIFTVSFFLSADKFGWPWLKIDEMLKPGKECTVRWGLNPGACALIF